MPDKFDHIMARCDHYVKQRIEPINELHRICDICYEKYLSVRLMTFVLRGWVELPSYAWHLVL